LLFDWWIETERQAHLDRGPPGPWDQVQRQVLCPLFVIQGFFNNLNHDWLLEFIQHRVSDKRILKMLFC
jgi:hypothetical protein